MILKLENYACFDKTELTMQKGLHLIHGDNGMGKSSLVESIGWCIWQYNNKLDSKKGISSVIKKGSPFCKVSLNTGAQIFYRERTITQSRTNIKDIDELTPISYDIYRQIVHVNFSTAIMQMTSGKKNNLLSALSNSEVINGCANKLNKDCSDLRSIYNEYLKEMYGIQGVIKEFKGTPASKFEADYDTKLRLQIDNLSYTLKDHQGNKNKFTAQKCQKDNAVSILSDNNTCPNCLQPIREDYKEHQLSILKKDIANLHSAIAKFEHLIGRNVKKLNDLRVDLDHYIYYQKVQDKINTMTTIEDEIKKLDKKIEIHKKWYDFFSSNGSRGAKAALANVYTQYIEEFIRNLQNVFDFDLKLNWEDNTLTIFVNTIPYEYQGNGIKRRLDVLLSLALRQLVVYLKGDLGICNYLVMDELFNNLDSKGIEETLELLKMVDISYPTYIISPRYVDFDWDSTIEVNEGKIKITT
ncbi:MAG: AAA family ATPase [bacterium]